LTAKSTTRKKKNNSKNADAKNTSAQDSVGTQHHEAGGSGFVPVSPFDIVVFGGTGDLARRKLLPSLFHRYCDGQIPENSRIIGVSRSKHSREDYQKLISKAYHEFSDEEDFDAKKWAAFSEMLDYYSIDVMSDAADWSEFAAVFKGAETKTRVFYLAMPPRMYATIWNNIYRIDHYLGKETVQNLLVLRFANILLEPLWSHSAIEHVQITAAESIGVGGRGSYYDGAGALRDMVQNHLLQLLCLTAMEAPASLTADDVRTEKIKVLRALRPISADDIQSLTCEPPCHTPSA